MAERLFGQGVALAEQRPTPLQPTPTPGSTYVRPVQKQVGGRAAAVADALGGLNKALLTYGAMEAQLRQDPNSTLNRDFTDTLAGRSVEELTALAGQGDLTRIQEDSLASILGFRVSDQFQRDFSEYASTDFDQAGGDLASELNTQRLAAMNALPTDAARSAFWAATDGYTTRILADDLDRRVAGAQGEMSTGVLAMYRTIATDGAAAGLGTDEIVNQVIAAGAANRTFAQLDGAAQNGILFALAQEYATQGNTAMVEGLLNHPRGGVGALIGTAEYAVSGNELIRTSRSRGNEAAGDADLQVRLGLETVSNDGMFTADAAASAQELYPHLTPAYLAGLVDHSTRVRAAAEENNRREAEVQGFALAAQQEENAVMAGALSMSGNVGGFAQLRDAVVPNASGNGTRTITAEDQQDFVVETWIKAIEDQRAANIRGGMSEEQANQLSFEQTVTRFATSGGAIHPQWEAALNSTAVIANRDLLFNGQPPAPELIEAAELYRRIAATNPVYANRLLNDEDTRRFFEAFADAREGGGNSGGLDAQRALQHAANVVSRPAGYGGNPSAANVTEVMAGLDFEQGWFTFRDRGFQESPTNSSIARDFVQMYLDQGNTEARAVERAQERMQNEFVPINGVLVPSTDRNFPTDFAVAVPEILTSVAESLRMVENGLIDSATDLTVMPFGNSWVVIDQRTGLPPTGNQITITGQWIEDYMTSRRVNEGGALSPAHSATGFFITAQAEERGLTHMAGPNGFTGWYSPRTGRLFEQSVETDENGQTEIVWRMLPRTTFSDLGFEPGALSPAPFQYLGPVTP